MKKILLVTSALVALGAGPANAGPVAAAVAWVGNTIAAGGLAAAALQTAIGIGGSLLAQVLGRARMGSPEISVKFDVEFGDDRPLSFIVGDYVTAGKRKYIGSWGKNTRFITEVVELSSLPQPGLVGAYVDDEPAEFTGMIWGIDPNDNPDNFSDQGEYAPGDLPVGWITAGRAVSNYSDDGNRIYIKYVDGGQTAADPFLTMIFGNDPDYPWTADMIGTGKSYAIITTRYDSDTLTSYPQYLFQPEALPMYDIRKDSTAGGSGAHRWGVATTYEPTRNPAVIAYNIVRGIYFGSEWVFGGKNLAAWRLPAAEWMAAANECDAEVNLDGGGTEPAYRCGMEITVDMAAADVLEEIGKAANMHFAEVGGMLKPIVGLPGSASLAFTDDDIIITEGQSFKPFYPVSETYNALSATYPEPGEKWATKDSPEFIDTDATADDGGRYLPTSVSYPAAPYGKQVQRLQRAQMQDFRRFRRHQFHLPPDAYALEPGVDMVSWTSQRNGYENKLFVVESVSKTPGMNVLVSLREVDPSDYDWSSDFEAPINITAPVNPIPFTQPINGLTVTPAIVKDNASADRRPAILVQCTGDEAGVTDIQIEGRVQGEPVTITTTRKFAEPFGWYLLDVMPLTVYEVRARLLSNLTPKSQWSTWLTVTTPDVRLQWADLAEEIEQAVQDAQDQADDVAQQIQDERDRAMAVEAALEAAVDDLNTDVEGVQGDLTDAVSTINDEITDVRNDLTTEIDQVYVDFQAADEGIQTQVDLLSLQVSNTSYIRTTDGDGGIGQWTALTGAASPATSTNVPPGQTGTSINVTAPGGYEQPYYSGVNINGTVFRIRGWVRVSAGSTGRVAIVGSTLGNGPGGETVLAQSDPISSGWQQIDMTFTVGVDTDEWAPAFLVDTGFIRFWRVRLEDYSAAANLEAAIDANAQAIITESQARVQLGLDLTAAYESADSNLQAGITSNTTAIADEEAARIADIERLEARSLRTLNNKTNFQDGDRGNWTSGTIEDVTVQGYTKALRITGISNEEPIRDGDVRGWTVRVRGLARTNGGTGIFQVGIQRFNNSSNLGHVSATALAAGQDWTEFDVTIPISSGFSDSNRWRIRTTTPSGGEVDIAWIEFTDITDAAEALAAVQTEALARAAEDSALAGRIDTVEATVGDNTSAITTETAARVSADNALAAQITTLESEVDDNAAAITAEAITRADADSALSGRITTVEAISDDNTAAIEAEQIARSTADDALAGDITTLQTQVGDNESAIQQEAIARANGDSALAAQITSLEASFGSDGNLIKKSDFSDGEVGLWTGTGSAGVRTTSGSVPPQAPAGDQSLVVEQTSGASGTILAVEGDPRVGNIGGKTLAISGYARANASGSPNIHIGVRYTTTEGGSETGGIWTQVRAGGQGWGYFSVTVTVSDAKTYSWRPQIRLTGGAGGNWAGVVWSPRIEIVDEVAVQANATAETAATVGANNTTAIANITNTVTAEYGSWGAFVNQTSTAIAEQNGFAAGFFGLTAETSGGNIVGIKGTTWDDPDGSGGSVLRLVGETTIVEGTLGAYQLAIFDPANLVPDNDFQLAGAWGLPSGPFSIGGGSSFFSSINGLRYDSTGGTGFTNYVNSKQFSVAQGKEYYCTVRCQAGTAYNVHSQIVWVNSSGSNIVGNDISPQTGTDTGNTLYTQNITAPSNAVKAFVRVRVQQSETGSAVNIGDIVVRAKEPGSTLITPNSITTPLLVTGAVTASKIAVNNLSAVSATVGLLRTATSGERMEIHSNQIRVYDASNTIRVRIGNLG